MFGVDVFSADHVARRAPEDLQELRRMSDKLCVTCKHFVVSEGKPGYYEPFEPARMTCRIGLHPDADLTLGWEVDDKEFKDWIAYAKWCARFDNE